MFEGEEGAAAPVTALLDRLSTTIDALIALDLTRLCRGDLLELLRGLETQRRRLPVVDHALIAELDRRGAAGELSARDTASLLREVLRVTPREATARHEAALDLGPGWSLTGQPRPPLLPGQRPARVRSAAHNVSTASESCASAVAT